MSPENEFFICLFLGFVFSRSPILRETQIVAPARVSLRCRGTPHRSSSAHVASGRACGLFLSLQPSHRLFAGYAIRTVPFLSQGLLLFRAIPSGARSTAALPIAFFQSGFVVLWNRKAFLGRSLLYILNQDTGHRCDVGQPARTIVSPCES